MFVGALSYNAFQPAAEFRGRDLARVGLANGREMRRVNETGFDKGEAVIEFNSIDVKARIWNTQFGQRTAVEYPLISKIMNRKDRRKLSMRPLEVAGN
jgi:hypothetical protein